MSRNSIEGPIPLLVGIAVRSADPYDELHAPPSESDSPPSWNTAHGTSTLLTEQQIDPTGDEQSDR